MRSSGSSAAVRLVSAATMPQPMSTPTAEGRSAFLVATTLPTVAPRPKCASAMRQTGPARIGRREVRNACSRALSSSSLAHDVRFGFIWFGILFTSRSVDTVTTK